MDLISSLGNATFENYVVMESGFTEMAYQMSAHVLTLGYVIMLADVSSKVIYGILLTLTAQEMSKADGYDYEKLENAI